MSSTDRAVSGFGIAAATALAALCPTTVALAAAPPTKPRHDPQPVLVRINDSGFHWADAGIGAAAGFGAALVLSGSFVLISQRDRVGRHSSQHMEEQR
jgi:hypothetical protein